MAFWRYMNTASGHGKKPGAEDAVAGCRVHMGAAGDGGTPDGEAQGDLMVAEPLTKPKRPPLYRVILLNDDYTPMDFVVLVLEQIFRKPHGDALQLMLQVHEKGAAIAGVYTRDIAETKVELVIEYARINDYPLQCTLEKDA
ncbi:MAG: ATP-dependent Clp protease adapter ClpS [Alphaproteobacteria bacterium]